MNELESGKDKIKKICEILKQESLEPAKEESQKLLVEAKEEAERLIQEAKQQAAQIAKSNQEAMAKERRVFESSLEQATKQALEALRQDIETRFFSDQLATWVQEQTSDPKVGAELISALVEALKKEGTSADFSAAIGSKVSTEKVNALLAKQILSQLKEKSVVLGNFAGGVQIKLHDHNLTLDMSDEALRELMQRYLRKDFREIIFKKT